MLPPTSLKGAWSMLDAARGEGAPKFTIDKLFFSRPSKNFRGRRSFGVTLKKA
jgi:hypothetical protein